MDITNSHSHPFLARGFEIVKSQKLLGAHFWDTTLVAQTKTASS